MTLKSYLWGIRISTILSFVALVLVIFDIDPEKAGVAGQLFFYASALLFLSGFFVLLFTWLKEKIEGEAHVGVSFRQGILMALLTIVLLIFQQNRILTWWDGALVVAAILLIELYFLTKK
jgi:hypothetical protein